MRLKLTNMNKKTFTEKELLELRFIVGTMLSWGPGGCYGDGDEITDKKGYATAKRILAKLDTN